MRHFAVFSGWQKLTSDDESDQYWTKIEEGGGVGKN